MRPRFGGQHPPAFFGNQQRVESSHSHLSFDFVNGGSRFAREQQYVVAGEQCIRMGRGRLGERRESLHRHGVGKYQPFKAQFLPQNSLDDGVAQGRGLVGGGVEGWNVQVCSHHGASPLLNQRSERCQFNGIQPISVVADDGQCVMRIRVGVPMSGKVFGRCEHPHILKAFGVGTAQDAGQLRAASKRTASDDWVQRIAVDVHHRRKIYVHAHGL